MVFWASEFFALPRVVLSPTKLHATNWVFLSGHPYVAQYNQWLQRLPVHNVANRWIISKLLRVHLSKPCRCVYENAFSVVNAKYRTEQTHQPGDSPHIKGIGSGERWLDKKACRLHCSVWSVVWDEVGTRGSHFLQSHFYQKIVQLIPVGASAAYLQRCCTLKIYGKQNGYNVMVIPAKSGTKVKQTFANKAVFLLANGAWNFKPGLTPVSFLWPNSCLNSFNNKKNPNWAKKKKRKKKPSRSFLTVQIATTLPNMLVCWMKRWPSPSKSETEAVADYSPIFEVDIS